MILFGAPRTHRHPAVGAMTWMDPLHRLRFVLPLGSIASIGV